MDSIKSSMSNIDISVVVSELNKILIDSWLNNIYQINNIFLFRFRSVKNENLTLLFEPGKRIHLTNFIRETPKTPSPIVMSLRKKIKRLKVEEIKQHDLDRLLYIKLSKDQMNYTIVFELFAEGNLILLDSENKILYAIKYRKMRDRDLLPKKEYIFPPERGKNILNLTKDSIKELFSKPAKDLIRAIASNLNLAGEYAEEIVALSNLNPNTKLNQISEKEIEDILSNLKLIINKTKTETSKSKIIFNEKENMISVIPFNFKKYENFKFKEYNNFNQALDSYFSIFESEKLTSVSDVKKESKLKSLLKIKKDQEQAIDSLKKKIELHKSTGDLIYSNYQLVDELLKTIQTANKKNLGWPDIIRKLNIAKDKGYPSAKIFHEINTKSAKLIVNINQNLIELDFRKSITENANHFYQLSKKEENKLNGALSAIKDTDKRIKEYESTIQKEIKKEIIRKQRKKEWYEKFRWFITSNGFIVTGGKDAKTNEILVKKYLEKGDKVFHADIHGAPIVILKIGSKSPTKDSLYESAQFAASYSKAWQNGSGQIDVYWIEYDQISFSPPSGQYLPKGSFIITGKRNYIKNTKLELAFGIKYQKEFAIPICGPTSAILKNTDLSIPLKFGNISSGKLARKIKDYFIKKAKDNNKKLVANISIDEIQNILPPKSSDIEIRVVFIIWGIGGLI